MKLKITIFLLFGFMYSYGQLYHEQLVLDRNMTFEEIVEASEKHFDVIGRERGLGYKQFQRWKYWAERNLDAQGRIRNDQAALNAFNKFAGTNNGQQRSMTGTYEELGPLATINTSTWSSALGRISAIGLDPGNDDHLIAGSPTGGIWKTTDYGTNWTPLFDDQLLMDVFSLEISHANADHYFVGLSGKIMKSIDGGTNWYDVTLTSFGLFNTLEMDPNNSNIIYAVEQNAGKVHRSTDGGESFVVVMDHNSRMYDLEFHPTDPNVIYASGNDAVYKSTDGGLNFNEITTGPWSGSGNTIMMAVTPGTPDNLYALEETDGGFNALYFSSNEGQTWSTLSDNSCNCNNIMGYNQNSSGGQAPRDMDVIVSPVDPDIIHVAGVETWRTTDAGQNWTKTTNWSSPGASNFIHADVDLLIYDGDRILAGTDGGIYYSTNEATSWTDITFGIGVRQFYRIGASQTEIDRVSGGSQDNGTGVLKSGDWYDFVGADGMETLIDWSDEDIIYTTIQFGSLYKSINGGQSLSSINTPSGDGNWVTPLEQDPTDANTVYTGREEVWKSTNGGQNWTSISNFNLNESTDELKIAPSDNNYIYAAYDDTMYYSSDGGANWNSTNLAITRVNYIAVHPTDPLRLAITVSGSASKVMESFDGGATWTDITANIPAAISIECVLYEPAGNGDLYIGGNPGIFHTLDSTNPNWQNISDNLPKVRVTELEVRNNTLYVGTYGRGLWKYELGCENGNVGDICDDSDPCTINDAINALCECVGDFIDEDEDGICAMDDPDDMDPCVPVECPPCTAVTLTIVLDNYPEETTWEIKDASGSTVASGGAYGSEPDGSTVMEMECLIDGCYDFIIYDSYGDGICCGYGNGSYELADAAGTILASGGEFGSIETTNFCVTAEVPCEDEGMPCDDGDVCTTGSTYDSECECTGGVYTDMDNDGFCIGEDPDDNDICVPEPNDPSCDCTELLSSDLDSSWQGWIDGGSDARRSTNDAAYAYSGTRCVRLRDDSESSMITSPSMNFEINTEAKIHFTYVGSGMEAGEGFAVDISTDGGSNFVVVQEWVVDVDFQNEVREFETASYVGELSSDVIVRFRCQGSNNHDYVYLDDIVIEGCGFNEGCAIVETNDFSSWGIWNDAGSDARRSIHDAAYANSGDRCVRLRDGSSTSNTYTDNIDLDIFSTGTFSFNFISVGMDEGESLSVEISTDGGLTFNTVAEWIVDIDFTNDVRKFVSTQLTGPFSTTTQLRIRNHGSDNLDYVYVDDVNLRMCGTEGPPINYSSSSSRSIASSALDFELYPNPIVASNEMAVRIFSDAQEVQLTVLDMYGKVISTGSVSSKDYSVFKLSTLDYQVGTYLVRVDSEQSYSIKKMIIIK